MVVFWKNRPEQNQMYPKDSKWEEVYIPTKMLLQQSNRDLIYYTDIWDSHLL